MIIAIDGPSGAGKSTVARGVARALGLAFLDTGAMYRAVTLEVLRRGLDPANEEHCHRTARGLALAFDSGGRILIDGVSGEPHVRSEAVTRAVSAVSAHERVRAIVVERQQCLARQTGGIVAEGRDTTTVVFPDATHKFFLTASSRVRAQRRALELGDASQTDRIQREIQERDRADSTRVHSPLRQAPDAIVIDTDALDSEGAVRAIVDHVRKCAG